MAAAPDQFRQALSHWASGVSIVTSRHAERMQGMTVSAFCSVSLEPPLVLVCVEKGCSIVEILETSKALGISVLAADQAALSNRFASRELESHRFDGLACEDGKTGCPRIPGALAWLDCRVLQSVDAGDHTIHVAEVVEIEVPGGDPLLHFRGTYRKLEPAND